MKNNLELIFVNFGNKLNNQNYKEMINVIKLHNKLLNKLKKIWGIKPKFDKLSPHNQKDNIIQMSIIIINNRNKINNI